jgi:peptidoglycan-associated lipoprotein
LLPNNNSSAQTQAINRTPNASPNALNTSNNTNRSGMPNERLVHFEFNKSEILGRDRPVVENNAKYMTSGSYNGAVRLEGHTDERGSREYNRALGERRAESIKQSLNLLGVSEQQVNILSYGEERPLDNGHDESAWQQNRRVEIVYQ